ncbi:pyridoxal phosphate-dependent aminotransferase [Flavobacteriaceae bacterium]|jgi:aspartate aminotransferase|nr:pyridoxal phosphate-dependent aminotransferase [Flavobacteriaceae bacterium]MDA8643965.1 pyridoxal phosphate-dependent aminotransferase [Flavobacteriaceae bacterium]MDA9037366.1 pyridoxal phosphate-dependent aminotransferase [Flavobacteriaceae bacterium]MDA9851189.1 pyridoxal phosphate-dependent aminotransferase [Flavobacteriaceae bacterium]
MPHLSQRGTDLPTSPIRKLVVFSDDAKSRGIDVLHLNIGQPDIEAPKEALEAVQNAKLKLLPYGPSQGELSYRKKLVKYYHKHQIEVEPEDILVTTGASEALTFALNAICDAGDEIIIPEPFYANYNGFASASSVKVVPVISEFNSQFQLPSLENISEKINSKTKAILLCNPSNPTGYVYSLSEISTLCELALKHNIFLIVDEVYREFIHGDIKHYSVLRHPKGANHTVIIDSVSKRYSLCGARVGCIVSKNKALIQNLLKFAHLRLSPPTYALIASEAALDAPESYLKGVIKEYSKRRKVLIDALEQIPEVEVSHPMGAFYCIAKLPVDDAEAFSKFLLTSFQNKGQTIMLAPAAGFYSTPNIGKNEVRIAFILNSEKLLRATKILEQGLIAYKKIHMETPV